jgi:hypothetical protein
MNPYAFKIGDTRKYAPYESNGVGKQLRTKVKMSFKTFKESMLGDAE